MIEFGFVNSASFPAEDIDSSMSLLERLKAGIIELQKDNESLTATFGSMQFPDLPLDEKYSTLRANRDVVRKWMDTALFFLRLLDQRTPVTEGADENERALVQGVVLDMSCPKHDPKAYQNVLAAHFRKGCLLSIASCEKWSGDTCEFTVAFENEEGELDEKQILVDNIACVTTAAEVGKRAVVRSAEHRFANWASLTNHAERTEEFCEWLADIEKLKGLEAIVMRSLEQAKNNNYLPDGNLVKKLNFEKFALFEVRAFYRGSNNVRLLFSRAKGGGVIFLLGGLKTTTNWYEQVYEKVGKIWERDVKVS